MDAITISLLLLLAVVTSGWLARLSPVPVSLPFVQIILGAVIASIARFRVQLDLDIFFSSSCLHSCSSMAGAFRRKASFVTPYF